MKRKRKMLVVEPIVWPRADPTALAAFDERTKHCTMNCGPSTDDPRDARERKLLCGECFVDADRRREKEQMMAVFCDAERRSERRRMTTEPKQDDPSHAVLSTAGLGWVDCHDELPPMWEQVVIFYHDVFAVGWRVDRNDIRGGPPWVINGRSGGSQWEFQRPSHWLKGLAPPNAK